MLNAQEQHGQPSQSKKGTQVCKCKLIYKVLGKKGLLALLSPSTTTRGHFSYALISARLITDLTKLLTKSIEVLAQFSTTTEVGRCWQLSKLPPRYWRTQETDRYCYLFQCSKATTEDTLRSKRQGRHKPEGSISYRVPYISLPYYKPLPLTPKCTTLVVTFCHLQDQARVLLWILNRIWPLGCKGGLPEY